MPNVPYLYEVNGKLVTGNGSLTPIRSLLLHRPTAFAVDNPKVSKFHERITRENVFLHYF